MRGSLRPTVQLTGELDAVRAQRIIVPRTPLWEMAIRWMESDGAEVAAGQIVLELDNSQFAGDLENRRLAESSAVNELMRKEADLEASLADKALVLEQARVDLQKARIEAAVPQEILGRREYEELQLELSRTAVRGEKAQDDLEATRAAGGAELQQLRLAHRKAADDVVVAERAIEALTLRAPSDGILVVARNEREGRKYQTGDTAWVGLAVMSIPDLDAMQVEAWLSDVDDGRVVPGMRAESRLDAWPERVFTGTVIDVSPIAVEQARDSLRRAFRVRVGLDEPDPELMRPGMSVRAEIGAAPLEDVLIVARTAVDFESATPQVRLGDGSVVEVQLGPCDAQRCVVVEGLREGQQVRTHG